MARQRPSLKSYISVNDEDEYREKICDASSDNGQDNNGAEDNLTNDGDDVFIPISESNETRNDTRRTCTLTSKLKICVSAAVIVVILSIVIFVTIPKSSKKDKVHSVSAAQKSHQYVNTHTKEPECLYHEKAESYTRESNPLRDRCEPGSPFVSKLCPSDASHHGCSDCNGKLLPNFCFCDIGQQCNSQDAPRKQKCSWCKDNCPCLNNGTCICDDKTGEGLYCKCPEGYDGTYCENIPYRRCKIDHEASELEHCKKSRNETCFINIKDIKLKCTISKSKHL
ncbi:uncharacterized protein LOC134706289 isoform X2 [Mytilus trossulus]|uniref:uncharacterized protein LOC134706289 isoform X2 n=1 Tax=Mytilus trossulus TaxID=6551 RepID=UPI0030063095